MTAVLTIKVLSFSINKYLQLWRAAHKVSDTDSGSAAAALKCPDDTMGVFIPEVTSSLSRHPAFVAHARHAKCHLIRRKES